MSQKYRLAAAALLLACAAATPARAGNLVANASENPVGSVSNTSPASYVDAYWTDPQSPHAWATVTRTRIEALSDGTGVQPPGIYGAEGYSSTNYTLWDLGTNAALDGATAAALDLSFNYTMVGTTDLPPVSLSLVTAAYSVALFSSVANTAGMSLSVVYGPVPPFPSLGYQYTGDMALAGSYSLAFSVLHENAAGGLMQMRYANSASNSGDAWGVLTLASITLADGAMPASGLGVRLETGELIVVSAVPEPATWMLWLGAGAWLAARRRLQAA